MKKPVDKQFLAIVILLMVVGYFIFNSASLGLLARGGERYDNVAFSQVFYGLFLGTLAMIGASRIPYQTWRSWSFGIFVGSLILTAAVFIPGIGMEHGGANRWLRIGSFSFQPSEFLKVGTILYLAALLSAAKGRISEPRKGLVPLLAVLGAVSLVLGLQPDTDTMMVIGAAAVAMYMVQGAPWKHFFAIVGLAGIMLVALVFSRPYLLSRFMTFFDPSDNSQTSGYQIQQSFIAIGSGGMTGRGFGQSIQKFNFLPEPIGDSIFAVAAEEWGFVGATALVLLFFIFTVRGLRIATRVQEPFPRLVVVGAVILIASQAAVNIGAMVGIMPLSGITLPFVSHGGTALLVTLGLMGVILSISRAKQQSET
jgi:cell division protein FtsW